MACYISRWYDDQHIPHYFGIEAVSRVELERDGHDVVYQTTSEDDMWAYLSDVRVNRDSDDAGDVGTLSWTNLDEPPTPDTEGDELV